MLHWLVYFGLVVLGACLALGAVAAAVVGHWCLERAKHWLRAYSDSQDKLTEARINLATAAARAEVLNMRVEDEKRGKAHWGAVNASEAVMDTALEMASDVQVLQARLDNLMLRTEWIRAGGNPQAPWVEVVRWKKGSKT